MAFIADDGDEVGGMAVRAVLADGWDRMDSRYAGLGATPWQAQADRVRAGEPVEISEWEFRAACRKAGVPAPVEDRPRDRFVLHPDGRIEAIHHRY